MVNKKDTSLSKDFIFYLEKMDDKQNRINKVTNEQENTSVCWAFWKHWHSDSGEAHSTMLSAAVHSKCSVIISPRLLEYASDTVTFCEWRN